MNLLLFIIIIFPVFLGMREDDISIESSSLSHSLFLSHSPKMREIGKCNFDSRGLKVKCKIKENKEDFKFPLVTGSMRKLSRYGKTNGRIFLLAEYVILLWF